MENSTDSPHPIRYWCEGKALGEFARGASRLRRSGIYFRGDQGRKVGWARTGRRAGQEGMPVLRGSAPSNARDNRQGTLGLRLTHPAAVELVCHLKTFSAVQVEDCC